MSNHTRTTSHTAPLASKRSKAVAPSALLDALRTSLRGSPPLLALESDTYARDHAAFEARSNQRLLISDHLTRYLHGLGDGPLSVLAVGCGDGSLDVPLARGLLSRGLMNRPVRYVGVDPYVSGTSKFATAMAALDEPFLTVETHPTSWAAARPAGPFDLITFVHSMYYVPDVAEAVLKAFPLLQPGGELLILSGPRGEMNTLVDICAPALEGHRQWFSEDVAAGIASAGKQIRIDVAPMTTLQALLDPEPATADVLDFTVQAQLTSHASSLVRDYLHAVSVPDPVTGEPRVPHPVDVHRVIRPR